MLLAMWAVAVNGFAQQVQGEEGRWTLIGKLSNSVDTLLVVPADNARDMNQMTRTDGVFRFSTELAQAKDYLVLTPSILRGERAGFYFAVTAVPGEVLVAEGFCDMQKPASGLTYGGTKFYGSYTEAATAISQVTALQTAQPALDFVKAHPDSESAACLVGYVGTYCPDRLNDLLALLSPTVRNGRMKAFIDQEIANAKAYVEQQSHKEQSLAAGSQAPDFTLNDLSGKPLSLSSLKGKYVVLDFWGSWCGWCIKGFPKMKEYYTKYKDKMEILGMDCSDTVEKWKKAVSDNELPWLQVYVPKDSKVTADYMVNAFPTKIVLSPEGKVIATVVGEDPKFYLMLDELFKAD